MLNIKNKRTDLSRCIIMLGTMLSLIFIDQISKFLTVLQIPLHDEVNVLSGVFHLTYAQNTGAAFSMLKGHQWLFVVIVVILLICSVWEFWHKSLPFKEFERWCIVAILAGGISNNLIDRLRFGYVIDMIELDFISFPVFNLADCFITCGCLLLLFHLIFFNRNFWNEKEKHLKTK